MRSRPFVLMLCSTLVLAAPVSAQTAPLDSRVGKLEKEMRAVQRKVFPGGNEQFFEPEIAPPSEASDPAGNPASTPITDLTARVTALEGQLATMTGQIEQNEFKLRQLETRLNALDGRLKAIEPAPEPAAETVSTPSSLGAGTPVAAPAAAPAKPATAKPEVPKPGAKVDAARAERIAAIEKPATGDAADDEYVYGYRLWEAKLYPEAQAQLEKVVSKYPKHRRASFAQNLLGRAYLDEGKPGLAAKAFFENYQTMPRGERAPESLYYLGQSLTRMKKAADACKAYAEFDAVYGATASEALKANVAKAKTDAKCK